MVAIEKVGIGVAITFVGLSAMVGAYLLADKYVGKQGMDVEISVNRAEGLRLSDADTIVVLGASSGEFAQGVAAAFAEQNSDISEELPEEPSVPDVDATTSAVNSDN